MLPQMKAITCESQNEIERKKKRNAWVTEHKHGAWTAIMLSNTFFLFEHSLWDHYNNEPICQPIDRTA